MICVNQFHYLRSNPDLPAKFVCTSWKMGPNWKTGRCADAAITFIPKIPWEEASMKVWNKQAYVQPGHRQTWRSIPWVTKRSVLLWCVLKRVRGFVSERRFHATEHFHHDGCSHIYWQGSRNQCTQNWCWTMCAADFRWHVHSHPTFSYMNSRSHTISKHTYYVSFEFGSVATLFGCTAELYG